jgi:sulfite exporter TauE/SafE
VRAVKPPANQRAAALVAFGLGTWPAVLAGGWISAQISQLARARARGLNAVAGALLALFGAITAIAPFVSMSRP